MMPDVLLLVLTCALLYLGSKFLSFVKALQAIQYYPGNRTLFSNVSLLGNILPRIWGISMGRNHLFAEKHQTFESVGWDIYSLVSVLPNIRTTLFLADAAAIKEVTLSRARFPKPVGDYEDVGFYGHNIVVSEGEEWKKYRKISAPAFSDRNNKLVWDETVKIMHGLFNDLWENQDVISVDHGVDITIPIALFVIGAAGFGRTVSWKEDTVVPPGHMMSFKDALLVATTDFILKVAIPNWALGLTARLRKVKLGFEELRMYILEMIRDRQSAVEKTERHDLLANLLEANDQDLDGTNLSESELISNIYMFLVAGHETAAHTLCFTFALLALYQDEQEKLFEQIQSVTQGRGTPTYEEMPLLTQATAVFNETLRMFPPVPGIPKMSAEDTSLVVGNIHGGKRSVVVPKGTSVRLDTPGVHYNPRYWDDPHTFNPSRFLKDWPRDAFLPFSAGARACIGRKFFETEGIAVLTMLVSRFKITVKEEPQFVGETFEAKKSRILSAQSGLTLTPVRVPLVFTRRVAAE